MKISEIREIPVAELAERIANEKARLHQLQLGHSISPLENPSQLKDIRRTIARMLTVQREHELNNK